MTEQSAAPAVLLTRPAEAGARFAADLAGRFAGLRIVDSPLMAPVFLSPDLPEIEVEGHVFSSVSGVEAARRMGLVSMVAYCVGARTSEAARLAGYPARAMGHNAEALVEAILALMPPGPLLHLHGVETRGDIAARLTAGGIETREATVYDMQGQPLTDEARDLLAGPAPVVVPLFSPRSARLFAEAAAGVAAPLWLAALSPVVAEAARAIPAAERVTAATPDAAAMLEAVASLLLPQRGA